MNLSRYLVETYDLEEESSTILSSPNSHPILTDKQNLRTPIISKLTPSPPPIRRSSLISQPPLLTTSIFLPLLPPPSTRRNSKSSQSPPPTFARETLQSPEGGFIVLTDDPSVSALHLPPTLQTNQTITIKTNSRVNKSMDEASKIIDEEVRKSEDDVMKNNYRSPRG